MYIPKHFEETRLDVLHGLMRDYPLATIVMQTKHGLSANHIPLLLDDSVAPLGCLRGHVARANALWREASPESEVLAIFHGPNAYITPSWYPSKRETGKVVPTWNYAVVHAHGRLIVQDDVTWLRNTLEPLTRENEADFPEPWQVTDAPTDYIDKLLTAIVGIEIVITRLEGKWKVSQNQSEANREGVRNGLHTLGDTDATEIAEIIPAPSDPSEI